VAILNASETAAQSDSLEKSNDVQQNTNDSKSGKSS
jgi:hypothetical protein